MMGDPTKEWGEPTSHGLMFCQTSTQEVPQTETINNSVNKGNVRTMHMENTILDATAESGIDKNWCLIDKQLTCNTLINKKYLSIIRDAPDVQYLRVHFNSVVTHTNKIGDLPGNFDPVWYKPKGITNILYLLLELPILGEPRNPIIPLRRSEIRFSRTWIIPLTESGI